MESPQQVIYSLTGFLNTSHKDLSFRTIMMAFMILVFGQASFLKAAPSKDLDPRWTAFSLDSNISVEHKAWQQFLDKYLIFDDKGQSYMSYGKVNQQDKKMLEKYLSYLTELSPKDLSKKQQMAYWINLYNAKTVSLILDEYPVKSIRKLGKSWFSSGPWDDKVLVIDNIEVSLNDIEHRILRPIYNQASLHYALNCASYSCPNLSATVFTSANAQSQLAEGARNYINHARGVSFDKDGELVLSSIYKWYREDFGITRLDLLTHLIGYSDKALGDKLRAYEGSINYEYDWNLNELK